MKIHSAYKKTIRGRKTYKSNGKIIRKKSGMSESNEVRGGGGYL